MNNESKIIGRASATEKTPNQSNEFSFWLAPDVLANPFDIVEAESYRQSKTYGLVMNLEHSTDAIKDENKIPTGLIEMSNGTKAPCFLDARYLLGPEGAHMNIFGISGLATKTSYVMFLLAAALQRYAEADKTAVILLNVKHDDLLHIHEPNGKLALPDREMWQALDLEAKRFLSGRVQYLLPNGKHTANTGRPNSHSTPDIPFDIHAYALSNAKDKLDLLMGRVPDVWDTMRSLIGEIQQKLEAPGKNPDWSSVKTWQGLFDGPGLVDKKENKARQVGEVAPLTVNRFRRILRRIVQTRQSGIFVDELNKSAPEGTRGSPILEQVLEVSERGRSLGIVLFGAQQFLSAVHDRVNGNCSMTLLGRTNAASYRSKPRTWPTPFATWPP
jgi:hypothetical protein